MGKILCKGNTDQVLSKPNTDQVLGTPNTDQATSTTNIGEMTKMNTNPVESSRDSNYLDPAQYPRLAPGGVSFQIKADPPRYTGRVPERLSKTQRVPLKHTPSEKKVLAHYLHEDLLEDRRIQERRKFRHREAARRRRETRAGVDQATIPDEDRETPTIARRVRNVKTIAAEVKVRVKAEVKGEFKAFTNMKNTKAQKR